MKPTTKRVLLFAGLAATLALAWFGPSDDEGAAAPALVKGRRAAPAAAEPRVKLAASAAATAPAAAAPDFAPSGPLQALDRAPAEAVPDLFKSFSWYVAPPPPPPPPPPASVPPSPPPLPFAYLGQYSDGGSNLILLTQGERILTVGIGAIIDRNYQVLNMKGGRLTFLYLPLQIEQSLITGVPQ